MGPHPGGGRHWSSFVSVVERAASHSTTEARGTASCGPSWRSGLAVTTSRGELLGAHDERVPGPGAIRLFELRLERTAIVGAHRPQPGPAQLGAQGARRGPTGHVDDEGVGGRGVDGEHTLGVTGQQQPLDADAEADARARRPADGLGQPVVAPTPADGVLRRGERRRRELEGGAGVVVEAAHQTRLEPVGHAELVEAVAHPGQVGGTGVVEVVGDPRRPLGHGPALGALAVEDPQGIDGDSAPGARRTAPMRAPRGTRARAAT